MSRRINRTIAATFVAIAAAMPSTALASSAVGPTGDGVPHGFTADSTSWTSADDGWVHGFTDGCTTSDCARLKSTDDGGATWTARNPPPFHLPSRSDGVRISAAPGDAALYATTGRRLDVTYDSGDTWRKVRLVGVEGQEQVGDIATTRHRVYAVVGQGDLDSGRTDLYSARLDHHRWKPVDGVTVNGNGVNVDGGWDVAAHDRNVAVSLGRIFVSSAFWTSSDGRTFTEQDPPCTNEQVTAIGAVSADRVAVLCSYNPGMGSQFKDLYAATGGGAFQKVGSAPTLGLSEDYVSLAPGEDVITAVSGASILYRSTESGWTNPLFIPDGVPFFDLQFPDADHGYVVWGGPKFGQGKLYSSSDAGVTWAPLKVS